MMTHKYLFLISIFLLLCGVIGCGIHTTRSEIRSVTYADGTTVKTTTVNGSTTTEITTSDGEKLGKVEFSRIVRESYDMPLSDSQFREIHVLYDGAFKVRVSKDADIHLKGDVVAHTPRSIENFKKKVTHVIRDGVLEITISLDPIAGVIPCREMFLMHMGTTCTENVVVEVPKGTQTPVRMGDRLVRLP